MNHMQIFLERLISEILETQTATRGLEQLLHVRKLLDECVRNLQQLVLKKSGRDPRGIMQLRSKFLMLSMADREARLPAQSRTELSKVSAPTPGRRGGVTPVSVMPSPSLPNVGLLTPSADAAAADQGNDEDWKVAYDGAEAEAKDAKRAAKRLRIRLAKAEQEAVRSEGLMKLTQKDLAAAQDRIHDLEQRLKSSDMALRNERSKQDALKAELSAIGGGGGGGMSFEATKNSTGGSIFTELNETPAEAVLRTQLREKTEEVGRRAVAIGKLEREVAKAGAKAKVR